MRRRAAGQRAAAIDTGQWPPDHRPVAPQETAWRDGVGADGAGLEILSRKLAAITDEMYFSVQRAARSSYVKEAADFATALLDPEGEVFAYPPSATFAFLIDTDFRTTIDKVPGLAPGDVIITNDPY